MPIPFVFYHNLVIVTLLDPFGEGEREATQPKCYELVLPRVKTEEQNRGRVGKRKK